ncbi:MAG: RluA family pseudouridine synthase [Anaerolineae bacterium]|nr:RluA family pseudouridine synthase [Anaerolineae bacterium]
MATEWTTLDVSTPTRLDQLLARRWNALDHEQIRTLILEDAVLVNGEPARKLGQRLDAGDTVRIRLPELSSAEAYRLPIGLSLPVLYEDDEVLVVDKPAGVAVRRSGAGPEIRDEATVPQILAARYPDRAHVGGVNRAGVVTTLDEEASGLLLVGKTEAAYRALRRLIKRQYEHEVYTVLVEGHLRDEITVDQPIGNVKRTRRRLAVAREGRPAQTYVRPQQHYIESGRDYTLLYVRPETSRMHQIRVHLAWLGLPVVGDQLYGSRRQPMLPDRLFLHLSQLRFMHSVTQEEIVVESPLPTELHSVLTYMRRPK